MIKTAHITLIGFGHMGQALTQGFLANGIPAGQIHGVDPSAQAHKTAKNLGIAFSSTLEEVVHRPCVVVLAVKPQQIQGVMPDLKPFVDKKTFFLSIAAGVEIARLTAFLGPEARVVRAMPNMPAAVGRGMTVLCAGENMAPAQLQMAEMLMSCVGESRWVEDEALLDVVTAVSGSGPAYFYLLMEALIHAGVKEGLTPELARTLAIQTCRGAGALVAAKEDAFSVCALRQAVMSKGGTTQAGINALEAHGFTKAVYAAVSAAIKRSRCL